jgi:prevent-host-death family protein
MPEQDTARKPETEVGLEDARRDFTELMGRAGYGGERFVLTRNGKPAAALVSIPDLERLRSLDTAAA